MTVHELAKKAAELVQAGTCGRAALQAQVSANRVASAHALHAAVRLGLLRYRANSDSYALVTK